MAETSGGGEELRLSPAQQRAMSQLMGNIPIGNVFVVGGESGLGITTVLRAAHQKLGGAFLNIKDIVDGMEGQHPLAIEETFMRVLWSAIKSKDVVIFDDRNLVAAVGMH